MSDSKGQYQKFPPGWDCKYDQATGNCYYINYLTKAMQLEDPRIRYKQLQNERCSTESIPMQPVHGSPYHVYPSNNLPAMRAAFQTGPGTNPSLQNVSSSPLFSSRGHLEMSPLPHPKSSLMQTPRLAHMSRRSTIQETSFSNQIDTDAVVTKIQNMFPTASEDHIRLLLKRYMKTIFPKADETLLLDILANADNNVQKASEQLISMGYAKRESVQPPKISNRPLVDSMHKQPGDEKFIPLRPKEYTHEEKETMLKFLKEKYPQTAERIILMALESVNYAEDRAIQILQIVQEDDETLAKKLTAGLETTLELDEETLTDGATVGVHGADAGDKNSQRDSKEDDVDNSQQQEFKSLLGCIATLGHNSELSKGPDENLLLADYVTWNGANPEISVGHKQNVGGADTNMKNERSYTPVGRNPELCKGPKAALAKGSIYAQLSVGSGKSNNIKCN